MLIVTGAPGCSVIKEAIMRQASERKTGSLSENKNLLGRLCGAHTNFNCLLLSQSSHPACPPYTADATRSPFSRLQRKKEGIKKSKNMRLLTGGEYVNQATPMKSNLPHHDALF